jgi:hypothetical protein
MSETSLNFLISSLVKELEQEIKNALESKKIDFTLVQEFTVKPYLENYQSGTRLYIRAGLKRGLETAVGSVPPPAWMPGNGYQESDKSKWNNLDSALQLLADRINCPIWFAGNSWQAKYQPDGKEPLWPITLDQLKCLAQITNESLRFLSLEDGKPFFEFTWESIRGWWQYDYYEEEGESDRSLHLVRKQDAKPLCLEMTSDGRGIINQVMDMIFAHNDNIFNFHLPPIPGGPWFDPFVKVIRDGSLVESSVIGLAYRKDNYIHVLKTLIDSLPAGHPSLPELQRVLTDYHDDVRLEESQNSRKTIPAVPGESNLSQDDWRNWALTILDTALENPQIWLRTGTEAMIRQIRVLMLSYPDKAVFAITYAWHYEKRYSDVLLRILYFQSSEICHAIPNESAEPPQHTQTEADLLKQAGNLSDPVPLKNNFHCDSIFPEDGGWVTGFEKNRPYTALVGFMGTRWFGRDSVMDSIDYEVLEHYTGEMNKILHQLADICFLRNN